MKKFNYTTVFLVFFIIYIISLIERFVYYPDFYDQLIILINDPKKPFFHLFAAPLVFIFSIRLISSLWKKENFTATQRSSLILLAFVLIGFIGYFSFKDSTEGFYKRVNMPYDLNYLNIDYQQLYSKFNLSHELRKKGIAEKKCFEFNSDTTARFENYLSTPYGSYLHPILIKERNIRNLRSKTSYYNNFLTFTGFLSAGLFVICAFMSLFYLRNISDRIVRDSKSKVSEIIYHFSLNWIILLVFSFWSILNFYSEFYINFYFAIVPSYLKVIFILFIIFFLLERLSNKYIELIFEDSLAINTDTKKSSKQLMYDKIIFGSVIAFLSGVLLDLFSGQVVLKICAEIAVGSLLSIFISQTVFYIIPIFILIINDPPKKWFLEESLPNP